MNKPHNNTATILAWVAVFIFTMYIAVMMAGQWEDGINIFEYMYRISSLSDPLDIRINNYTLNFTLVFTCIYGICISAYYEYTSRRRINEEHGSATWGNPKQVKEALINSNTV